MRRAAFCAAVFAAAVFCACLRPACAAPLSAADLARIAQAEEQSLGAHIGIAVRNSHGGLIAAWRGGERFPLTSTYKALLCGAVLHEAAAGRLDLAEQIRFTKQDLVSYSPVTQHFTAPNSMSLRQLCAAAVSHSDNTAVNMLARRLGGPQAITRIWRAMGDTESRLDRYEPELNSAIPHDRRDTTTPLGISLTLQKMLFGAALPVQQRAILREFMLGDAVAGALLRRSLPQGWHIADKSGAGAHGARSIIAAVIPSVPQKPFVIAIYIWQTEADSAERDAAIARIGARIFALMAEPARR